MKRFATFAALGMLSLCGLAAEGDHKGEKPAPIQTPADQSNAPEDVKLVAAIRQAVVKDPSLTSRAKNCKIITTAGQVTLRGAVHTAEEKAAIEKHATAAAGAGKVNNLLEVKAD